MISIKKYSKSIIFCLLAISIVLQVNGTSASELDKSQIKKQFDVTFYKMLKDPSDVDMTMKYADLAIQLEDYEAAIPALERVLMFNPNLPSIKAELGVLYYRLESFVMAKSYFEDSVRGDDVPEDVRATANEYLNVLSEIN